MDVKMCKLSESSSIVPHPRSTREAAVETVTHAILPLPFSIQILLIQICSCSAAKTSVEIVATEIIIMLKIEKSKNFIILEKISTY
jgi:hypothetical protein